MKNGTRRPAWRSTAVPLTGPRWIVACAIGGGPFIRPISCGDDGTPLRARPYNLWQPSRRMSRLLRALVAIVAIAGSVGGRVSPAAAAAPERRLFLVADSVALGAAPAIRSAFAGWTVAIEG